MRGLVERLRGEGLAVERLDLGGGLGVPYFNQPDPPAPGRLRRDDRAGCMDGPRTSSSPSSPAG